MLIAFAGLPGTGKTTLARALARDLGAVLVRIDSLEQGIVESALGVLSAEDAGYRAGYGVAEDNLDLGRTVVADSVNPVPQTRLGWQRVAVNAGVPLVTVEMVCSDLAEHRRRVETRSSDIPGLCLPTWGQVMRRAYHPWASPPTLVVETAGRSVAACLDEIRTVVRSYPTSPSETGAAIGAR